MLSDRRRRVLSALVQEYVRSAQPVASRQLVDHYELHVSPATVRNELAVLEDSGLVYQPHVSAGRMPTDAGYRAFVDGLLESGPPEGLTAEEVADVRVRYETLEHEVTEAMRETSAMLSRLTSYVAIAVAPAHRKSRIKRVNLVWLGETRVVVVVVTDSGRVSDRVADLPEPIGQEQLGSVERLLNGWLEGHAGGEVTSWRPVLESAVQISPRVAAALVEEVMSCAREVDADRVVTGGVPSLLAQPEFADPHLVGGLLQLLEDGIATLQILTRVTAPGDVVVRIGSENPSGFDRFSVVSAAYEAEGNEGVVGVIGPTRMDYPRAVAAVRTVADRLSETLG